MKKNIVFLLFACIFTVACSTTLQFNSKELIKIKKGLSSEQVIELLKNEKNANIIEHNKALINEVKIPNNSNKYTIIFAAKYQYTIGNSYICAFENDKLIYWGTQLEFARHNSPLLKAIGEEVVKIMKEYAKK